MNGELRKSMGNFEDWVTSYSDLKNKLTLAATEN